MTRGGEQVNRRTSMILRQVTLGYKGVGTSVDGKKTVEESNQLGECPKRPESRGAIESEKGKACLFFVLSLFALSIDNNKG